MPIELNMDAFNPDSNTTVTKMKRRHIPKDHASELTGTGGTIGLLSEKLNPLKNTNIRTDKKFYNTKSTKKSPGLERTIIPVSINLESNFMAKMPKLPDSACNVAKDGMNPTYIWVIPHDFVITRNLDTNAKDITVSYEAYRFFGDLTSPTDVYMCNRSRHNGTFDVDFVVDIQKWINSITNFHDIDIQKVLTYFTEYNIYEGTCDALDLSYDNIVSYIDDKLSSTRNVHDVASILHNMECFSYPLETYKDICDNIVKAIAIGNLNSSDLSRLKRNNTTFMTVLTLNELKDAKPSLTTFKSKPLPNPNMYSTIQRDAIADDDPLVLVQSGAGTGKSTVILGRIQHMIDCGVKPEDILVLSFTNAAADHILDLYPTVRSTTIASMIHTLYTSNYPTHCLSSELTLRNMLRCLPNKSNVVKTLSSYLAYGDTMSLYKFTEFYDFVADNVDDVIAILNEVGQTTLMLEIFICSIKMSALNVPKEIMSKHIMVDEVQDTSMFELVYILNYTCYNHNSLFMVGDCSQTLYEFRFANPNMLNAIEASGVFKTHALNINYRSAQPILDFANVLLGDIEANKYANIRLRSNNIAKTSYDEFVSSVHVNYTQLRKKADLSENIPAMLSRPEITHFIKDALQKHEKIAVLGYARSTVAACEDVLKKIYPQANSMNICPRVTYDVGILSSYVSTYWNNVQYFDKYNFLHDLCTDMINRYTSGNSKTDAANRDIIQKFGAETYQSAIAWRNQLTANAITVNDYIDKFRTALINWEIRFNANRRHVTSSINRAEKESMAVKNADIILSTIHSVKGLEYDHVIIVYDDSVHDEVTKRLYYVALTRAKKSEYVLGYGLTSYSNIKEWHRYLANSLDPNYVAADAGQLPIA